MSTTPIHTPQHSFTSILHDEALAINVWIIIITAILFFMVLAWYNAVLSIYNFVIGNNPNRLEDYNELNRFTMIAAIVYALLWTGITIACYWILASGGKLYGPSASSHPLLRQEAGIGKVGGVLGAV